MVTCIAFAVGGIGSAVGIARALIELRAVDRGALIVPTLAVGGIDGTVGIACAFIGLRAGDLGALVAAAYTIDRIGTAVLIP